MSSFIKICKFSRIENFLNCAKNLNSDGKTHVYETIEIDTHSTANFLLPAVLKKTFEKNLSAFSEVKPKFIAF